MFCNNCGKQVDDGTTFCPNCGKQIGTPAENTAAQQSAQQPAPAKPASNDSNTIAIVGFIFSFFGGIIGLVCSIIGYVNAKKGAPNKGLALAGIIISCLWAVGIIIMIIAIIATGAAFAGEIAGAAGEFYEAVLPLIM